MVFLGAFRVLTISVCPHSSLRNAVQCSKAILYKVHPVKSFVFRNGRFGHKIIRDLYKVLNNHSKVSWRRQDLQKTNSYRRVVSIICTRLSCSASQQSNHSLFWPDTAYYKRTIKLPSTQQIAVSTDKSVIKWSFVKKGSTQSRIDSFAKQPYLM